MAYLLEIHDSESPYSVVVEEDEKVAYAYLRDGLRIVSDVWLYNVGPAPHDPEWSDPDRAPFANPSRYTKREPSPVIAGERDLECRWIRDGGNVVAAEVVIRGRVYARLEPGSKPGWSRLAARDGPLARALR